MRARVNFPTPRGPAKSRACGTRWVRKAPRRAVTIRGLPRNSEKAMRYAPPCPESRATGVLSTCSTAAWISRAISFTECMAPLAESKHSMVTHGALRASWSYAKIEDEILARQVVDAVLEMLDPPLKFGAFFGNDASSLMREIGADVAVDEHDFALVEGRLDLGLGFEAVAGIEQRGEMRVHGFERAERAVEELADHSAEPGIVLRKAGGVNAIAAGHKHTREQIELRALAAAVDAFDGDQPTPELFIFR